VLFVLVLGARVLSAQGLPEGPGSEILKNRCVSCHQTDLITAQRLSPAAWGRELDKMIRWGAVVDATERDLLMPPNAIRCSRISPRISVRRPRPRILPRRARPHTPAPV
jgi:hypothetical protein